jgi:membrane protein
MVLGIGFLLLVSLAISAALAALGSFMQSKLPGGTVLWEIINFLISYFFTTLLFAMIYKVLPDIDLAWRDVWVGALFTAFCFTVGKLAIGLYLGRATIGSTYGAAGSVVIIMLWVYYSAQVILFGAEFTYSYVKQMGSKAGGNPHKPPAVVERV